MISIRCCYKSSFKIMFSFPYLPFTVFNFHYPSSYHLISFYSLPILNLTLFKLYLPFACPFINSFCAYFYLLFLEMPIYSIDVPFSSHFFLYFTTVHFYLLQFLMFSVGRIVLCFSLSLSLSLS